MYISRVYPLKEMLIWTKRYIIIFLILSLIPVFLYAILDWKWLHLPWQPIGLLGTAVAFIAGFKNNASYDRLWEARKIWGGIVNASRSWTIMIKDFISNAHTDNPVSEGELKGIHREMVHRHVAWMTALRYQMRSPKKWELHNIERSKKTKYGRNNFYDVYEDTIPLKEALGTYISPEEKTEILAKGNRASQLLGIQSRRLRELHSKGLIEHFRHMEMKNMLVELYTLQGKSERIKNFPYPRQFATLNFYFVWIFIILLPYGVMETFENIGQGVIAEMMNHEHTEEHSIMHHLTDFLGANFVWLSVPFSALISWVFYTLEMIGESTENPFEGGANDVPITSMTRGIEIDIRQLIDDSDIPPKYEWKNDVVM